MVTPADEFIAEVNSRSPTMLDRTWHEIRAVSIGQGLWDVWFESDDGASICVSIAQHSNETRILCDEFEFSCLNRSEAAAFVVAVLGGDVSFHRSGLLRRSLTMTVAGRWSASASLRPGGLSSWEQKHFKRLWPPDPSEQEQGTN